MIIGQIRDSDMVFVIGRLQIPSKWTGSANTAVNTGIYQYTVVFQCRELGLDPHHIAEEMSKRQFFLYLQKDRSSKIFSFQVPEPHQDDASLQHWHPD
jgi:hypothetical protein